MNNYYQKLLRKLMKDGYTRVPHIVFVALTASSLNGTQKSLCSHLIRNTFGWGKIAEAISINDFARGCQSERSWIRRQLHDVVKKRVFIQLNSQSPGTNETGIYMFNHNITQWDKSCIDLDQFMEYHNYQIIERRQ